MTQLTIYVQFKSEKYDEIKSMLENIINDMSDRVNNAGNIWDTETTFLDNCNYCFIRDEHSDSDYDGDLTEGIK